MIFSISYFTIAIYSFANAIFHFAVTVAHTAAAVPHSAVAVPAVRSPRFLHVSLFMTMHVSDEEPTEATEAATQTTKPSTGCCTFRSLVILAYFCCCLSSAFTPIFTCHPF